MENYDLLSDSEKQRLDTYPYLPKGRKEREALKKQMNIKNVHTTKNFRLEKCICGKTFNMYYIADHLISVQHRLYYLNQEREKYGLHPFCRV